MKTIKGLILLLIGKICKNLRYENLGKWFLIDGDQNFILNQDLKKDSVVFEVGAYKGSFSKEIYSRYDSVIYAFEPVKHFFNLLSSNIEKSSKVHLYQFGLGDLSHKVKINIDNDGSSTIKSGNSSEIIKIENINEFIKHNRIKKIDLIQINIEGGEYELLSSLIKSGNINIIKKIQVQFHKINDKSDKKMSDLISKISKTHLMIYNFPYVWTGFVKKEER